VLVAHTETAVQTQQQWAIQRLAAVEVAATGLTKRVDQGEARLVISNPLALVLRAPRVKVTLVVIQVQHIKLAAAVVKVLVVQLVIAALVVLVVLVAQPFLRGRVQHQVVQVEGMLAVAAVAAGAALARAVALVVLAAVEMLLVLVQVMLELPTQAAAALAGEKVTQSVVLAVLGS
jgi:hypothetical protein